MRMLQAWGMTETSPMCTTARPPEGLDVEEQLGDPHDAGAPRAVRRAAPDRRRRRRGSLGRRARPARSRCAGRGSRRATTARTRREKFDAGWLRTGDIACRRRRLRADHRPLQGRDQVGRRVDLLGRARERADVPPRRRRGGGDRRARRALGRAPAGLRRGERGGAGDARRADRASAQPRRPLVAARRVRVRAEVPKTSVGKFDKRRLRAALADGRLEGRVRVESSPPI